MATQQPEASLFTIRAYELIFTATMLLTTIYVYRTRSPLNLGAYIAAAFGGGACFEWVFDSRFYFRVSADDRFIPFWTVQGDRHPLVMLPIWAAIFGGPFVMLVENHDWLVRRFGERGLYVFLAAVVGALGTTAFETFNTSVAGIYRYHQREGFLFYGMPYSNMWLVAMIVIGPYWSMRKVQVLVKLLGRTSESERSQWWIAFLLGLACVITPWVLAGSLNFIWYIWTQPWTETLRTF